MKARIQRWIRTLFPFVGAELSRAAMQTLLREEHRQLKHDVALQTPENPCLHGYKAWSQFDEDGIIEFITRKLNIANGTFIEFGCGDGMENNTHLLLLRGWRGIWVDGSKGNFDHITGHIPAQSRVLLVDNSLVTRGNVLAIIENGSKQLGLPDIDLLSMDLDGNDIYLLETILQRVAPKIIIAEYNGKIPYGVDLAIEYDEHAWRHGDDYWGASLSLLVRKLKGYTLVTCGLSGINAFFVRNDLASAFTPYPAQLLFQPARNHLAMYAVGSRPSLRFLADVIRNTGNWTANTPQ